MKRVGLLRILALVGACASLAATAAPAGAARISVGNLILRADGGFTPRQLPRRTYVPIRFEGHGNIEMRDGSAPPALRRIRLDFDRDGKLTTTGLPVCHAGQIEGTSTQDARSRCGGAQVGSGNVAATAALPFLGRVNVKAPLTLFNGPKQNGGWTVLAHAQTNVLLPETYVVTIPIEPRRGGYAYRSTFDIPPLLGGLAALTHIDAKVGRRYTAGGQERSFISARCSDGILQTQGYASFADGTIMSGALFKPCSVQR
ncbi:MAG TPA: hypothetical protein VF729_06895 [Solirubrobacterales bacterium]